MDDHRASRSEFLMEEFERRRKRRRFFSEIIGALVGQIRN
jgi:hypothetical protein